jgi:hypothetical protein
VKTTLASTPNDRWTSGAVLRAISPQQCRDILPDLPALLPEVLASALAGDDFTRVTCLVVLDAIVSAGGAPTGYKRAYLPPYGRSCGWHEPLYCGIFVGASLVLEADAVATLACRAWTNSASHTSTTSNWCARVALAGCDPVRLLGLLQRAPLHSTSALSGPSAHGVLHSKYAVCVDLYGRAGRLTTPNGGFRAGQCSRTRRPSWSARQ